MRPMREEELRDYQEAIRYATEELCGADDDLFLHRHHYPNECNLCGRPAPDGTGYCDQCRLGPI